MAGKILHFRELNVYKNAKEVAMAIFNLSKDFPGEEKYSLTDQVRRSSRSVCANVAEAWRKRRYKAAFIAKLNDCEAECSETQVWLELAYECSYINHDTFKALDEKCEQIAGMLVRMAVDADKWVVYVNEDKVEYGDVE